MKFKVGDRVEFIGFQEKKRSYDYESAPLLKAGMRGTVLEDATRPWIEFDSPTGYEYKGCLGNKKDCVYCVGEDDLKRVDKIETGDIVRIRKDCTLGDLTENYWNGCQASTMKFLFNESYGTNFDKNYTVKNVANTYLKLGGFDYFINIKVFELVKKKTKEMTLEEVCKELGYDVKIIKE